MHAREDKVDAVLASHFTIVPFSYQILITTWNASIIDVSGHMYKNSRLQNFKNFVFKHWSIKS